MMEINKYAALLRQIHVAMEKAGNNILRECGLTIAQVFLLNALIDSESGACSLKELEKLLQIGQSTTVGLVKRLKQKGFVTCYEDMEDKRIRIVCITPDGAATCKLARAKLAQTSERLIAGMTDAEQLVLLQLLERVHQNISSDT